MKTKLLAYHETIPIDPFLEFFAGIKATLNSHPEAARTSLAGATSSLQEHVWARLISHADTLEAFQQLARVTLTTGDTQDVESRQVRANQVIDMIFAQYAQRSGAAAVGFPNINREKTILLCTYLKALANAFFEDPGVEPLFIPYLRQHLEAKLRETTAPGLSDLQREDLLSHYDCEARLELPELLLDLSSYKDDSQWGVMNVTSHESLLTPAAKNLVWRGLLASYEQSNYLAELITLCISGPLIDYLMNLFFDDYVNQAVLAQSAKPDDTPARRILQQRLYTQLSYLEYAIKKIPEDYDQLLGQARRQLGQHVRALPETEYIQLSADTSQSIMTIFQDTRSVEGNGRKRH